MGILTVEPVDFIFPPYKICPNCRSESFGVWIVGEHHYSRRCKRCLHRGRSESLPSLDKKVIYIDQFAISNMMKAVNAISKTSPKKTDPFFLELFELLDQLCKMQLIVCPASFFHTWESLVSPFFEELEKCYDLLSCGVKFYDPETIRRFQIEEHAINWIAGNPGKALTLDVHSVVTGSIDAWSRRLQVSANILFGSETVQDLVKWRNSRHEGMSEIFRSWQVETNRKFEDWVKEEAEAYGMTYLRSYLDVLKELLRASCENAVLDVPSDKVFTVYCVLNCFREAGVPPEEIMSKLVDYFLSPYFMDLPFVRISSMLHASIARKAAAGQKRLPSKGMANDIETISVLLPYCDAMFVDKECHAYLTEKPVLDQINYNTLKFSLNFKQDFLGYLRDIRSGASELLLKKLTEVYGKSWHEPFATDCHDSVGGPSLMI